MNKSDYLHKIGKRTYDNWLPGTNKSGKDRQISFKLTTSQDDYLFFYCAKYNLFHSTNVKYYLQQQ